MENMYLRVADASDMDLLFQWANEALVRKNSFSTRKITYKEHVEWYERLLHNENIVQYILMYGEQPIGQARITLYGDVAEIGYSICEDQRAHGYGKELLRMVTKQVWQEFPDISKVIGKIKPENIASLKAFSSVGYKEKYRVYEMQKSD